MPMPPNRPVFSTLDRDGNEVRLTESQWLGHILFYHPDMESITRIWNPASKKSSA